MEEGGVWEWVVGVCVCRFGAMAALLQIAQNGGYFGSGHTPQQQQTPLTEMQ